MISLSDNEQQVLYAIARYPEYNDRELADQCGLSKYTVNKIRHRLEDGGYFRRIRLPQLGRLGAELFSVTHGTIGDLIADLERPDGVGAAVARDRSGGDTERPHMPGVFLLASENEEGFGFAFARNFTAIKYQVHRVQQQFSTMTPRIESMHYTLFSLPLANLARFFDYAPLLRAHFDLDIAAADPLSHERSSTLQLIPDREPALPAPPSFVYDDTARQTFIALVEEPALTDTTLSEMIDVSRQKISRLRRRFYAEEYMRTLTIVDLKRLGFEVLALVQFQLHPNFAELVTETRFALAAYLDNIIVLLREGLTFFVIGVFETLGHCKKAQSELSRYIQRHQLFREEPRLSLYSLSDLTLWRDHRYGPPTRELFASVVDAGDEREG